MYLSSPKVAVILVGFSRKFNYFSIFSKNTKRSNPTKICPLGAEISLTMDGRTDTTTLIIAFLNFANAPRNTHPCTL